MNQRITTRNRGPNLYFPIQNQSITVLGMLYTLNTIYYLPGITRELSNNPLRIGQLIQEHAERELGYWIYGITDAAGTTLAQPLLSIELYQQSAHDTP